MSEKISVNITKGDDLKFSDDLMIPMKTCSELDIILSSEGGLMPATNMVIAGGAGSGKTTVTLDMLARLHAHGRKVLFISGEMDEIGYYKYCRRLGAISKIPVLFLKQHTDNIAVVMEAVLNQGYDAVALDSVAEVLGMYRDAYKTTETAAERWLLNLEDKHKMGENAEGKYTCFINIQQVTKNGTFVGSNRLKHMTDAFCHIERSKDGLERSLHFSKNRDCDKDFKMYFSIHQGSVYYTYEFLNS